MNNLSNQYNPFRNVWSFSYPPSAMALSEWKYMSDDDPWKVSTLICAVVELFLSVLLLLGAAIAFFTSRFAKFFGLEPPCTYVGCAHSIHSESPTGQMHCAPPSCKPKDLCRGDFCPDCHPLRIHSRSHSRSATIQEEESELFDFSNHNAGVQYLDDSSGDSGECHARHSCSERPWNHRRLTKVATSAHTASASKVKKDDYPLPLSRSGLRSSGEVSAKEHSEISQDPLDSEEELAWQRAYAKREKNIDSDEILAHDSEAPERSGVSEDFNERLLGISSSLLECIPEVEELRVSKHDLEEDDGLVNIEIHLVQGTCLNVLDSEKGTQHSRILILQDHLERTHQKVDDDHCLQKGPVASHSSSLELSCQEAIVEKHQKASLDGADGRVLEGEQGGLIMQDSGRGVKDVSEDAIPTKDLSEHAKELALSEDKERELISGQKQVEELDALKLALQAERSVLAALEAELESERNAAAVATSEAMAMISRLHEEKSAMQMKVAQLQRMSEEKAEYDEQAMALLKEILYKREIENIALEKEVELYRDTLSDELKRIRLSEESESPLRQSLKPLLLPGAEEFLSPVEDLRQKHALPFPEKGYKSGISSAPWIPQHGPGTDFEELNGFSPDQNVNKRSRDFSMNDMAASLDLRTWDEEGIPKYHFDRGVHGPLCYSEQRNTTERSIVSKNDEEFESVLERLWVLDEELQKLRGNDRLGSQSKAHGDQRLAIVSPHKSSNKRLSEAWDGQNVFGIKSKEQRKEVDMDGVAEGFVPIHDVYEVQSASYQSASFADEKDPSEGFEGISGNLELCLRDTPESISRARMAKHRISLSPRITPAKSFFASNEAPSTPVYTPQAAGWIVGKSLHPEDVSDPHDLQAQSVVLREKRDTTQEDVRQLELRLKTLEKDRELWRESLESFTHRDEELNLLQEIAQHLRELRMAGFKNVSGGVFLEDIVTATSPTKNRPVKKRRYCLGSGQAQRPLLFQKSV